MHSSSATRTIFRRVLIIISLLTLVAGCGGGQGSGSITPTATNNQEKLSSTPVTSTLPPNKDGVVDVHGLRIRSSEGVGIGCSPDYFSYVPNAVVLAQNRRDYDAGELHRVQEFVNASAHIGPISEVYDTPYPAIPDPLQGTLGSITGSSDHWGYIPAWDVEAQLGCLGVLKITNVGQTSIQISQVSAQLTATPRRNTIHYRLVDFCMENTELFQAMAPACPSRPSGAISVYRAILNLKMSNAGTEFQSPLSGYGMVSHDAVPDVLLKPQDTLYLLLTFYSLDNLIYSIVPKLTIATAGEQSQILLPESMLAFANANQFSCYKLQGTRFVEVRQVLPQTDDIWCI